MYSVYIITTKENNSYYVGMTNNFERRIRQHNRDIRGGAKFTRRYTNWYPVLIIDGFHTKQTAMQCEWSVKNFRRKKREPYKYIRNVFQLMTSPRNKWTSNSPFISSQKLTVYLDDTIKMWCPLHNSYELWWKL